MNILRRDRRDGSGQRSSVGGGNIGGKRRPIELQRESIVQLGISFLRRQKRFDQTLLAANASNFIFRIFQETHIRIRSLSVQSLHALPKRNIRPPASVLMAHIPLHVHFERIPVSNQIRKCCLIEDGVVLDANVEQIFDGGNKALCASVFILASQKQNRLVFGADARAFRQRDEIHFLNFLIVRHEPDGSGFIRRLFPKAEKQIIFRRFLAGRRGWHAPLRKSRDDGPTNPVDKCRQKEQAKK